MSEEWIPVEKPPLGKLRNLEEEINIDQIKYDSLIGLQKRYGIPDEELQAIRFCNEVGDLDKALEKLDCIDDHYELVKKYLRATELSIRAYGRILALKKETDK